MSDKTAMGDRFKRYELAARAVLPRRTYTVIRVDGRAFHTLLRDAQKPFDWAFMESMVLTAEALAQEVSGTFLAYVQSDEISLVMQDFASTLTEPWFGGVVQKMASCAASFATAEFNMHYGRSASFDGRVFTVPDSVEVANYLIWRQRDAVRNSILMTAQSLFPHNDLLGLNTDQLQEKMFTEKGVNWNDTRPAAKRGTLVAHDITDCWLGRPAPHFAVEPGNELMALIPRMPSLP